MTTSTTVVLILLTDLALRRVWHGLGLSTDRIGLGLGWLQLGWVHAGILEGAWRTSKAGRCRVGWGIRRDVSSPASQGSLEERRELPQLDAGQTPAGNRFWRILKATECFFLYLYDKMMPPAPLYLRTLWRYTNAVIIIIIKI